MGFVWFGVLAITIPIKRVRSFFNEHQTFANGFLKNHDFAEKLSNYKKKSLFLVLIIKVTLNFTYKIIQTSCTNEFGLKPKKM